MKRLLFPAIALMLTLLPLNGQETASWLRKSAISPDGKTVDDVVIHVPDSGSLICLFGSVQASQLETVIANGQKK